MLQAPVCYTSRYRRSYCLVKSNICWGVGIWVVEEGLFWASVEQMPGCLGETSFPYKSEL